MLACTFSLDVYVAPGRQFLVQFLVMFLVCCVDGLNLVTKTGDCASSIGCSAKTHSPQLAQPAVLCCRFALYNVLGACLWIVLFVGAGFFFGNFPVVQHNFTLVVFGIVLISVLPVIFEVLAARSEAAREQQHGTGGEGHSKPAAGT